MLENLPNETRLFIYILITVFTSGLLLSILLLLWVLWRIKRIHLPEGADFLTALRFTPLSVVLLLDVLDMTLDIFGAPVAWVVLGKLGLHPLRTVTIVESFIPGTQFIPLLTASWLVARLAGKSRL
jgi:hypothetical protein